MTSLGSTYDVLLFDLDGTLYRGADAVPGAVEAVAAQRSRSFYVTNNASRRPAEVADHLRELGYPAADDEVVTSSQAGARLLAENLAPGAEVMVVGAAALCEEVERVGLVPVRTSGPNTAAVVQGHSPDTAWPVLAEAAFAIRAGAYWVATNTDATLPLARGLAPGNGAMVSALVTATDRQPEVAGKPFRALMQDAIDRSGGHHPLVIGDRLDTDIAGAVTVGLDSLLVLTGVSTAADLLAADRSMRPTYLAHSLAALDQSPDTCRVEAQSGWTLTRESGTVTLYRTDADPEVTVDADEGMRALRAAAAFTQDDPATTAVVPGDKAAASAIDTWYR